MCVVRGEKSKGSEKGRRESESTMKRKPLDFKKPKIEKVFKRSKINSGTRHIITPEKINTMTFMLRPLVLSPKVCYADCLGKGGKKKGGGGGGGGGAILLPL